MQISPKTGEFKARPGDWLIGLYAWLSALSFGAVLLDRVYAGSLAEAAGSAPVSLAFNEAADFLQLPLGLAVLAGLAVLVIAAERPSARNFVIASLALTLMPLPVMLFVGDGLAGGDVGGILRLAFGAGASLLAMAAAVCFFRLSQEA